ncbi:MAG TPA: hypothetical protein VHP11_18195 [Tepidisphaeraceae bacterium]|nr:hypothetical protein [Tepidisphaeraceae bacterium]
MTWQRPSPAELWKAIDIYLKHAYPTAPPSAVRARLETLRALPEADLYTSNACEHDNVPNPCRFSIRLGNRLYPHMKLVIEQTPDGNGYLFRADTHDRHACPQPGSRDYEPFCKLMEMNQQIAQAIEATWEREHLPTFKSYLKQDLARRAAQATPSPANQQKT